MAPTWRQVDARSVMVHALDPGAEPFPAPNVYCQLDLGEGLLESEGDDDEDEGEGEEEADGGAGRRPRPPTGVALRPGRRLGRPTRCAPRPGGMASTSKTAVRVSALDGRGTAQPSMSPPSASLTRVPGGLRMKLLHKTAQALCAPFSANC